MFAGNKFLNDFMKTQARLVHEAEAQKDSKKRTKSKHGTADGKPAFGDVTLATLISEMPPKKDILDYFREKVAQLVADDIDMHTG